MSGFVTLDIEVIKNHIGKEIEYYELWDFEMDNFRRGRAYIHNVYKDSLGRERIYSDLIWGDELDAAYYEREEGFCFSDGSFIYLAPTPFMIYEITWINESDLTQTKFVPVESMVEIDMIAKAITKNSYEAVRVNLDGSKYNTFQNG